MLKNVVEKRRFINTMSSLHMDTHLGGRIGKWPSVPQCTYATIIESAKAVPSLDYP